MYCINKDKIIILTNFSFTQSRLFHSRKFKKVIEALLNCTFKKHILYCLHTVKIGRPFFKKIISLCLPVCFGYEIILSDFLFLKKHKIPIIHMVDLTHILVSERVWVYNWYVLYSSLIVVVVKNFSVAAVIGPALHKRLVF